MCQLSVHVYVRAISNSAGTLNICSSRATANYFRQRDQQEPCGKHCRPVAKQSVQRPDVLRRYRTHQDALIAFPCTQAGANTTIGIEHHGRPMAYGTHHRHASLNGAYAHHQGMVWINTAPVPPGHHDQTGATLPMFPRKRGEIVVVTYRTSRAAPWARQHLNGCIALLCGFARNWVMLAIYLKA